MKLYKIASFLSNALTVQAFNKIVNIIARRHPEWKIDFIKSNLLTIIKLAPATITDINILEQALKKIYTYGSIEPSLIRELQEIDKNFRSMMRSVR